jgi:3-deoxy-D-manno-octulosonic-acid transferase
METELWPNLLFGCRDRGIPAYILNARLSARSLRGYRVLEPLIRRALRSVHLVAAQSREDGARFVRLGADPGRVVVTGNLKFDMAPGDDGAFVQEFRDHCAGTGPVWIAASTHEDEEAAVLDAHRAVLARQPGALLLWAPRHPERFRAVAQRLREQGFTVATRSEQRWPTDEQAFVVDTLGELTRFYACAPVGFVGGSLAPVGGHNLLEPAATRTAILTGPHLHNFADIARRLREADAMQVVEHAGALGGAVLALLEDPATRERMAGNALRLLEQGRGALRRTVALIEPALPRE